MPRFAATPGLNQSIALAKAGAAVWHAGQVGADGEELLQELQQAGVDTRFVGRCTSFADSCHSCSHHRIPQWRCCCDPAKA